METLLNGAWNSQIYNPSTMIDSDKLPGRLANAPGEIRTHDPRIRNPVLYPPELRGLK
jgi:hypothetical protein